MTTKTRLLTASDWADVQSQLESLFASVSFKYKDHKITVAREYQNESSSKLAVYIDDQIKGAWIDLNLGKIADTNELKDKPSVIDDVWMLKTQARYDKKFIASVEKIWGKREAKKRYPDLHDKRQYRWPYFNKASSVVRQFKKLEGIELCL
ncbi:hypothetical protein C1S99_10755 [Vibrio parahaemolyticus]|uniref:hypothetical protein n=1 Tax=Vibrio parahaemolyticus TaxID=670 RepID=UPI000530F516|nr:hypothetical protein [Vibrio parahaemolyticus]EJB8688801.1 hypothetical protein [Vibrio parahaemolyticus]EKH9212836.1 hypothetical protein [Vibrio parahaemolyticus]KGT35588.1 hypothetical protein HC02_04040 [Vibrio parahaemolyticus]PMS42189.1 hypothetical protein C1T12_11240 [Vibrio parahaemolyticus]PMS62249.1 hypothetical protein C1S91_15485 [Vibrio parahaemolyticus]